MCMYDITTNIVEKNVKSGYCQLEDVPRGEMAMNLGILNRSAMRITGVTSWRVMVFTLCLLTFSWHHRVEHSRSQIMMLLTPRGLSYAINTQLKAWKLS